MFAGLSVITLTDSWKLTLFKARSLGVATALSGPDSSLGCEPPVKQCYLVLIHDVSLRLRQFGGVEPEWSRYVIGKPNPLWNPEETETKRQQRGDDEEMMTEDRGRR
ncbi:hypothetical protein EYF80_003415 [Liparis tanakae]|uniref:Uncharacterized protein n=1 Tax=Liparis tanakae TaxID=230148 RepID=A0A4Z2J8B9_9TELE|nr:hypothetical protein EYF80_003415 [Liparis tanakae]